MVLDEYGADALRLYLINSPVVRGETLRFKKEGVFAVVKDVFLPWYNAYRFLVQNVLRLQQQTGISFEPTKVSSIIPKKAWSQDQVSVYLSFDILSVDCQEHTMASMQCVRCAMTWCCAGFGHAAYNVLHAMLVMLLQWHLCHAAMTPHTA